MFWVFLRTAGRWLGRVPFREVWLSVAVLLVIGENFPFSTFPMYSTLSKEAFYYMVTTTAGDPLPFATDFRTRASFVSKRLKTARRKVKDLPDGEALRVASLRVLEELLQGAVPEAQPRLRRAGLKLVEVRISTESGRLEEDRIVLAEIPPQ